MKQKKTQKTGITKVIIIAIIVIVVAMIVYIVQDRSATMSSPNIYPDQTSTQQSTTVTNEAELNADLSELENTDFTQFDQELDENIADTKSL